MGAIHSVFETAETEQKDVNDIYVKLECPSYIFFRAQLEFSVFATNDHQCVENQELYKKIDKLLLICHVQ